MNDLKFAYNGGHPLRIDDINHLQAGIKEMLKEIGNTFLKGNAPAILWGAEIYEDAGNSKNRAGALFIDGELFSMAPSTISGPLDVDIEYQIVEQFVAPSPVTYEDLSENNVHRVRKIILGRSTARPGDFVAGYAPTALLRISNNWVVPALSAAWIQKDPNSEGINLQYTIDYFQKKVEFRGCIHYDVGAVPASSVLFTLPLALRPAEKTIRPLYSSSNMSGVTFATNQYCYCIIDTNGDVSVDINLGPGLAYHFGGVYFYL